MNDRPNSEHKILMLQEGLNNSRPTNAKLAGFMRIVNIPRQAMHWLIVYQTVSLI